MASTEKAHGVLRRALPVFAKVVALCVVAVVALLLLLPAPPDQSAGGITRVTKHVPVLRETVDPLRPTPDEAEPARPPVIIEPVVPVQTQQPDRTSPANVAPSAPPPGRKPKDTVANRPSPKTDTSRLPSAAGGQVANVSPQQSPAVVPGRGSDLPSPADIQDWLRSQAWEFLGGVDPQGNILYRFEVWLEAPRSVLDGIKSVTYVYDAPSATPAQRESDNVDNGFRARFGSLACSKKVRVDVTMADGRTQRALADGCRALN